MKPLRHLEDDSPKVFGAVQQTHPLVASQGFPAINCDKLQCIESYTPFYHTQSSTNHYLSITSIKHIFLLMNITKNG
jgi:hypothetical protein